MSEYDFLSNRPEKRVTFKTSSSDNYMSREAFKALRTNIMFCGTDIKTIVITSTIGGEGKSTISSELSKCLSDGGKRTLLIDADMRKSVFLNSSQRTGEVKGISELLSGMSELKDVIYGTQEENFDVIFTGHFPPNPVDLLANGKLKKYLDIFKEHYDYVIIDAPPLAPVIDAAVIAQSVDAAIMVIAASKTHKKDIVKAKEQLEKSGIRIIGAVLNENDKRLSKISPYSKVNKYYY